MEDYVELNNVHDQQILHNDIRELASGIKSILLSKEDIKHLYEPRKHSIVIRLLGKKSLTGT